MWKWSLKSPPSVFCGKFTPPGERTFLIRLLPSGNCWRNRRVSSKFLCISTDFYRWSIICHQPFNVIFARSLQFTAAALSFWCSHCAWGWWSRRTVDASSISEEGLLSFGIYGLCLLNVCKRLTGHDILKKGSFWLRMQTLKTMILTATQQHLNEIDTPETIMIISFEWTAAHSSILWRVMDHDVKIWIIQQKDLEKNDIHLLGRLDCQLVWWCFTSDLCGMRVPTKVVASIFKVRHFTTFGKTSSWHA